MVDCAPAERLEASGAAVDGCRAADADEHAFGAAFNCGADELAGAVGGGLPGVALFVREEFDARGLGHFDDGGASIGGVPPLGGTFLADGIEGGGMDALSVEMLREQAPGAFAAVGKWAGTDHSVGGGCADPVGDGMGDVWRWEGVLVLVGGDENAHGYTSISRPRRLACVR